VARDSPSGEECLRLDTLPLLHQGIVVDERREDPTDYGTDPVEDTVWPYEGKLEEYIQKSGEIYSVEFVKSEEEKSQQLLDLEASYRTAYGSGKRREIVLWQKVLQPKGLLPLFRFEMPREYKQRGKWMLDGLQVRDQWQSALLRTTKWSPLF